MDGDQVYPSKMSAGNPEGDGGGVGLGFEEVEERSERASSTAAGSECGGRGRCVSLGSGVRLQGV